MFSNDRIHRLAERYRRLRRALPPGVEFQHFIQRPAHYEEVAQDAIRDWAENPRIGPIAFHHRIRLN